MATAEDYIDIGLPQFPDDALPTDVYVAFSIVHQAIQALVGEVTRLTGIQAPDQINWGASPPSSTVITGNATRMFLPASETLAVREFVNIFDDAGTLKVRKALADDPLTMAHGVTTTAGSTGELVTVQWATTFLVGFTGLTQGALYYLSDTVPGGITDVAPITSGSIVQPLGLAMKPTDLNINIPLNPQLIP